MTKQQARDLICEAFQLLGEKYASPEAERMLLAIGYQESGFEQRAQIGGPAKGFWQFEHFGGVAGVMRHPSTKNEALRVINDLKVSPFSRFVYVELEQNDLLAACFARLLLWTDPRPLPTYEQEAWQYYLHNWRPGKPHLERWADHWKKAEI